METNAPYRKCKDGSYQRKLLPMLLKSTSFDIELALEFCDAYNVHRQTAIKTFVEMLLLARGDVKDDSYKVCTWQTLAAFKLFVDTEGLEAAAGNLPSISVFLALPSIPSFGFPWIRWWLNPSSHIRRRESRRWLTKLTRRSRPSCCNMSACPR